MHAYGGLSEACVCVLYRYVSHLDNLLDLNSLVDVDSIRGLVAGAVYGAHGRTLTRSCPTVSAGRAGGGTVCVGEGTYWAW
jgi:hypothetical protein